MKKQNLSSTLLCICLIFINSTNAWIFRIRQCDMVFWPSNWQHGISAPIYDKLTYVCSVTVESSGIDNSLTEIVGNHSNGKTFTDIEVIEIVLSPHDNITRIPSNVGNLLPNLTGVGIYGVPITAITAEDLRQFPNLTYIAISDTGIVSLDDDLFKYTPHVQAILMPSNKIVSVGRHLLEDLKNLKFVDFLSNPCLSFYASTPQQLEWLKGNLTLECAAKVTTTKHPTPPTASTNTATTTLITPTATNSPLTTTSPSTTSPSTIATSSTITTPSTITTSSTIATPTASTTVSSTTVAPGDDCENCSLNAEIEALKNELTRQGALIQGIYDILSIHREEIDELKTGLTNQGVMIRDLYGIMSDHSHRIFQLEMIVEE